MYWKVLSLPPSLSLIYINDLSNGLKPNARIFVDNVSLFSVVDNINLSAITLSSNLSKIKTWVNRWKKILTLIPTSKRKISFFFSRKLKETSPLSLSFNNNFVKPAQFQKHLGFYMKGKFDFCEHLQNMFNVGLSPSKKICVICLIESP